MNAVDVVLERALAEDAPWGDATSDAFLPESADASAELVAREAGVLSGIGIFARAFTLTDPAVVVETVFSRQGLGSVTAAAVQAENIPIVQGVVLVSATIYAVVNLVVDVIYPLIDPRIVTRRSTRVSAPAVTVSA